ncbi:flagellar export chaperone FliS [Geoalkalibacter halelectricus]|uniref:Flagellar secretion chaperone FliS n=1 Tax=Geoalkalibacter halelectricus TaxID=2847045 RepID=A0ABY5ZL03_9BACT|nr:flagellar export chaperone FliS [Geoalkalibacter halelectricus]MDO3377870.1 flagellar export chaperone FliS [Geoalkalibacter halelectricus]UWZ77946.1 flagellar export chaperone FliS [Geoalkalibacter halelectricus]
MNAYFNQYRNTQVQTASPEQILVMLYDGAIRFLNQACVAMESDERDVKIKNLDKALAIIAELSATLDHEIGGEIAANLAALYDFMMREIPRANVKNDPKVLQPVINILAELREAWVQAAEIVRKERAGQAPEQPQLAATAY